MDEIRKNISIIYRQLNLFLNHELEGINITAMELIYLSSLYQNDGVTQDDLVQEYCIDKAATARAIQGMEKKGWSHGGPVVQTIVQKLCVLRRKQLRILRLFDKSSKNG